MRRERIAAPRVPERRRMRAVPSQRNLRLLGRPTPNPRRDRDRPTRPASPPPIRCSRAATNTTASGTGAVQLVRHDLVVFQRQFAVRPHHVGRDPSPRVSRFRAFGVLLVGAPRRLADFLFGLLCDHLPPPFRQIRREMPLRLLDGQAPLHVQAGAEQRHRDEDAEQNEQQQNRPEIAFPVSKGFRPSPPFGMGLVRAPPIHQPIQILTRPLEQRRRPDQESFPIRGRHDEQNTRARAQRQQREGPASGRDAVRPAEPSPEHTRPSTEWPRTETQRTPRRLAPWMPMTP